MQLADMLVNAGMVLVYITGLIGFAAWLDRSNVKRRVTISEIS